jgi:ribosomal protein S9
MDEDNFEIHLANENGYAFIIKMINGMLLINDSEYEDLEDDLVKAADLATNRVLDAIGSARTALERQIWTNGAGVLSDPSMVRTNLAQAQVAVERALKEIRACDWPRDADYGEG